MMTKERKQRARSYVIWNLQRDFANLSALVEAAVLEARHLISHKAQQQMLPAAELNEAERQHLERERRKRLAEITHRSGLALVKAVHGHKWAYPFNAPVDVNAFPNYAQIVKTPMDLGTIKQHLESGNHYKDPNEVWADVCLVFVNAKRYNTLGSDVYLMAEMVEEFAQERYEKVLAPKIAEESAQATREEVTAKRRQADLLNAAAATAAEQQCMRLLSLVDELLFSIKEAKSRAAAACQGASQEEVAALATAIARLPTAQLEAAVQFLAARHPTALQPQQVPAVPSAGSASDGEAAAPQRRVQLNLASFDALTLRQLQLYVHKCEPTDTQQQQLLSFPEGQRQEGQTLSVQQSKQQHHHHQHQQPQQHHQHQAVGQDQVLQQQHQQQQAVGQEQVQQHQQQQQQQAVGQEQQQQQQQQKAGAEKAPEAMDASGPGVDEAVSKDKAADPAAAEAAAPATSAHAAAEAAAAAPTISAPAGAEAGAAAGAGDCREAVSGLNDASAASASISSAASPGPHTSGTSDGTFLTTPAPHPSSGTKHHASASAAGPPPPQSTIAASTPPTAVSVERCIRDVLAAGNKGAEGGPGRTGSGAGLGSAGQQQQQQQQRAGTQRAAAQPSLSTQAGILWPGVPMGAGVRARGRSLVRSGAQQLAAQQEQDRVQARERARQEADRFEAERAESARVERKRAARDLEWERLEQVQLQAQAKGGLDLEIKGVGLKPEELATEDGPPKEHKNKKGRVDSQQEGGAPGNKAAAPHKASAATEKGGSAAVPVGGGPAAAAAAAAAAASAAAAVARAQQELLQQQLRTDAHTQQQQQRVVTGGQTQQQGPQLSLQERYMQLEQQQQLRQQQAAAAAAAAAGAGAAAAGGPGASSQQTEQPVVSPRPTSVSPRKHAGHKLPHLATPPSPFAAHNLPPLPASAAPAPSPRPAAAHPKAMPKEGALPVAGAPSPGSNRPPALGGSGSSSKAHFLPGAGQGTPVDPMSAAANVQLAAMLTSLYLPPQQQQQQQQQQAALSSKVQANQALSALGLLQLPDPAEQQQQQQQMFLQQLLQQQLRQQQQQQQPPPLQPQLQPLASAMSAMLIAAAVQQLQQQQQQQQQQGSSKAGAGPHGAAASHKRSAPQQQVPPSFAAPAPATSGGSLGAGQLAALQATLLGLSSSSGASGSGNINTMSSSSTTAMAPPPQAANPALASCIASSLMGFAPATSTGAAPTPQPKPPASFAAGQNSAGGAVGSGAGGGASSGAGAAASAPLIKIDSAQQQQIAAALSSLGIPSNGAGVAPQGGSTLGGAAATPASADAAAAQQQQQQQQEQQQQQQQQPQQQPGSGSGHGGGDSAEGLLRVDSAQQNMLHNMLQSIGKGA